MYIIYMNYKLINTNSVSEDFVISNMEISDDRLIKVNFRFEMDFEDVGELIARGQIEDGALIARVIWKDYDNAKLTDSSKFLRRINYLFYTTPYHITNNMSKMAQNHPIYEYWNVKRGY